MSCDILQLTFVVAAVSRCNKFSVFHPFSLNSLSTRKEMKKIVYLTKTVARCYQSEKFCGFEVEASSAQFC